MSKLNIFGIQYLPHFPKTVYIPYLVFGRIFLFVTTLTQAPWLANEQSWSGWSPLHSASSMGHCQVVSLLLHFGANPRSAL